MRRSDAEDHEFFHNDIDPFQLPLVAGQNYAISHQLSFPPVTKSTNRQFLPHFHLNCSPGGHNPYLLDIPSATKINQLLGKVPGEPLAPIIWKFAGVK